jgi:hypothetical protein
MVNATKDNIGVVALCIMMVSCSSSPRERTTSEQAIDVTLSAATKGFLGSSGGQSFNARLNAVVLGGYSCARLSPSSLKLRITDTRTGDVIALALPIEKDWTIFGSLKLLKGEHMFTLVETTGRELSTEKIVYSGETLWKIALKLRCPAAL